VRDASLTRKLPGKIDHGVNDVDRVDIETSLRQGNGC
jgi:hypothetical protein